jgi:hypothetical protein
MKFETEESDLEDVCYESIPDSLASALKIKSADKSKSPWRNHPQELF